MEEGLLRKFCREKKCPIQGTIEGKIDKGLSSVVVESIRKKYCTEKNCKKSSYEEKREGECC